MNNFDYPPIEIIKAAEQVTSWVASRNWQPGWAIAGVCDRAFADAARAATQPAGDAAERVRAYLNARGDDISNGRNHIHGYNGKFSLLVSDLRTLLAAPAATSTTSAPSEFGSPDLQAMIVAQATAPAATAPEPDDPLERLADYIPLADLILTSVAELRSALYEQRPPVQIDPMLVIDANRARRLERRLRDEGHDPERRMGFDRRARSEGMKY